MYVHRLESLRSESRHLGHQPLSARDAVDLDDQVEGSDELIPDPACFQPASRERAHGRRGLVSRLLRDARGFSSGDLDPVG